MNLAEHMNNTVTVDEHFTVDHPDVADWCLRKIAEAKRLIADRQSQADEWVGRVEWWYSYETRDANESIKFFEHHLAAYALANRADDRKSFTFPHGKVSTRQVGATVEITDEAKAIEWAKAHQPELVHVKETIAKTGWLIEDGAVRDPDTGQPVDGLSVKPGRITVQVST